MLRWVSVAPYIMTSNIFNQQETSNMFKDGLNRELDLTLIKEVGLLFICSTAQQVSVTTLRQLYAQMWVVNAGCMVLRAVCA